VAGRRPQPRRQRPAGSGRSSAGRPETGDEALQVGAHGTRLSWSPLACTFTPSSIRALLLNLGSCLLKRQTRKASPHIQLTRLRVAPTAEVNTDNKLGIAFIILNYNYRRTRVPWLCIHHVFHNQLTAPTALRPTSPPIAVACAYIAVIG